jgi:cation diffusion facilitator CzcD-associated flavoprotein CzcO
MTADAASLAALTDRVKTDLAMIGHPEPDWIPPRFLADGARVLDVLIVGAGQSGIATGFQLLRERAPNFLIIDKAPAQREGPWMTYARMRTLRSPKNFTGPDLGVPSLTYQAWHEAKYGAEHWRALALIAKEDWADYLHWVRETLALPVRNGATLTAIDPRADGMLDCVVNGQAIVARKLVLATGQDGCGEWWMPDFVKALPEHFRAHSADAIDFERLRGKRVAVLGAGASAMDNAATAAEAGARVDLFCRRSEIQRVQPFRWLTFNGFLRHLSDLEDAWRWRFMRHILGLREGFPADTYHRCMALPNFSLHTGSSWESAEVVGDQVEIRTAQGVHHADFLICGTGIRCDFTKRPELAPYADQIALWSDRYQPPAAERDDRLAEFPYLGADYALQPKTPDGPDFLRHIHVFNIGSSVSFGASGSSINAMNIAVPKLVAGVTRALFSEDAATHWAALQAYDVKMFELIERRDAAD